MPRRTKKRLSPSIRAKVEVVQRHINGPTANPNTAVERPASAHRVMSDAERARRYRERKKAVTTGDPVRAFLEGVVDDARRAVEAGNAEPW